MRNKQILAAVLIFAAFNSLGQNQIDLNINESVVGRNLLDGTDIIAKEYTFPDRIYKTFFDTTTNFLTVQLRGVKGKYYNNKGKIVQLNTSNNTIIWNKDINYQNANIQQLSKIIIQTQANKTQFLNIYSGNPTYDLKNQLYFVDPTLNIGVGYKSSSANNLSNTLEGIDLSDGKIMWHRDINRDYGWNDYFYIDDTTVIIMSAGLHSLNIKTGEGWDYDAVTGHKDYSGTVAKNVAGVALGVLTGVGMYATGHKLTYSMASNALTDNNYIYFASKEEIAKIGKTTGEILWKSKFESFAGESIIFMDSCNIYMINKGLARENSQQIPYKKPFYAAFNKQTGQKVYQVVFDEKDSPILGIKLSNDYAYLLFKNSILKYNITTGKSEIKQISAQQYGDLSFYVGNHVFIKYGEDSIKSIVATDTSKIFVFTKNGIALSIDENLNICDTISNDKLTVSRVDGAPLSFFANQDKISVINKDGIKCAELHTKLNDNAYIIKNSLFYIEDKKLCIVNLEDLYK